MRLAPTAAAFCLSSATASVLRMPNRGGASPVRKPKVGNCGAVTLACTTPLTVQPLSDASAMRASGSAARETATAMTATAKAKTPNTRYREDHRCREDQNTARPHACCSLCDNCQAPPRQAKLMTCAIQKSDFAPQSQATAGY